MKKTITIILISILFLIFSGCATLEMVTTEAGKHLKTYVGETLGEWENMSVDQNKVHSLDQPTLLILLDASSSMSERDHSGITKIDAARWVISDVVGQLDTNKTSVGLLAFNGGCNSARLYVEPTNTNPYRITAVVKKLPTGGKTPLASSINKAGEILSHAKQKVRLLIISDGIETCNGDPVYEAKMLMKLYDIEPTIYVVGYNVDSNARLQLKSIANVGKGGYFDVQDSATLGKMINEIVFSAKIKDSSFSKDGKIYKLSVNFSTGSDIIASQYNYDIESLAKYLVFNDFGAQIQGHTDDVGNNANNVNLSERRARAVYERLIAHGVNKSKLTYKGYGNSVPIATNSNESGRFLNRRTEAHIIKLY